MIAVASFYNQYLSDYSLKKAIALIATASFLYYIKTNHLKI